MTTTMRPLELPQFTPIDLSALIRQAEMLKRVDRKYCIPVEIAQEVLEDLAVETQILTIAGKQKMQYYSVYYDTSEFSTFYRAVTKRRKRAKVRQRWYVDTDTAFCEVKHTGPRKTTQKIRIETDIHNVLQGRLSEVEQQWVYSETGLTNLHPILWNSYDRSTLLLPDGAGRATIDTRVRWCNEADEELALGDEVIIETKTHHGESVLDVAIRRAGYRPERMSKFGTGAAVLYPHLPHNRWNRPLHRHFNPAVFS